MKTRPTFILLSVILAAATLPVMSAPQTMKDLAIEEARKFDTDHNNKIEGTEIFALRAEFKNNANSHLYIFDENSDHVLDDQEIAKIPLGPPSTPKPKPGKPTPANGKPAGTTHPHGAPRS